MSDGTRSEHAVTSPKPSRSPDRAVMPIAVFTFSILPVVFFSAAALIVVIFVNFEHIYNFFSLINLDVKLPTQKSKD